MKYLICNLKENKTYQDMQEYKEKLLSITPDEKIKLVICPSTPYLFLFNNQKYYIGSQDVSKYDGGAYTGEVGAKQLASLNVSFSLIGHSERRKYFNESNEDIIKKIENCFANNIKVILFIGEKDDYDTEVVKDIIQEQLSSILKNISNNNFEKLLIAYEPNWLIGKESIPNIQKLKKKLHFIRTLISEFTQIEIPIIYGGGINLNNFKDLLNLSEIDGFVIGENSKDINTIKNMYSLYTKNL